MKYFCNCGREKSTKLSKRCITCRLKPSIKFCKGCGKRLNRAIRKWCKKCYMIKLGVRLASQTRDKNPSWKGGRTYHTRGYIYIKNREHPFSDVQGYIFEHRLIMEKKIRRYLKPNEIVHHLNGIKDDNRIENLEIMTQSKHIGLHVNKK